MGPPRLRTPGAKAANHGAVETDASDAGPAGTRSVVIGAASAAKTGSVATGAVGPGPPGTPTAVWRSVPSATGTRAWLTAGRLPHSLDHRPGRSPSANHASRDLDWPTALSLVLPYTRRPGPPQLSRDVQRPTRTSPVSSPRA